MIFGMGDVSTMVGTYGVTSPMPVKLPKVRYGSYYGSYGYGGTGSDFYYNGSYHREEEDDDEAEEDYVYQHRKQTRRQKTKKASFGRCAPKYLAVSFPFSCAPRSNNTNHGGSAGRRKRDNEATSTSSNKDNRRSEDGDNNNGMSRKLFMKIARLISMKDIRLSKKFPSKKFNAGKSKRKKRWPTFTSTPCCSSSLLNCSPISGSFEPMPTIVEETESEILALTIHRFATMFHLGFVGPKESFSSTTPSSSSSEDYDGEVERTSQSSSTDDSESCPNGPKKGSNSTLQIPVESKSTLKYLKELFSPQNDIKTML